MGSSRGTLGGTTPLTDPQIHILKRGLGSVQILWCECSEWLGEFASWKGVACVHTLLYPDGTGLVVRGDGTPTRHLLPSPPAAAAAFFPHFCQVSLHCSWYRGQFDFLRGWQRAERSCRGGAAV